MFSIRLDPETERRLTELAERTGRTKSFYARELIEENLEDLEDRYLAELRLEKRRPALTSRQTKEILERIARGEKAIREGRTQSHAAAKRRLKRWFE